MDANQIGNIVALIVEALQTDGAHHKDEYLRDILKVLIEDLLKEKER